MRVNNALYKDYNNTLYELLTLQMFYDGYIYIYKWKVIISPPYLFFVPDSSSGSGDGGLSSFLYIFCSDQKAPTVISRKSKHGHF